MPVLFYDIWTFDIFTVLITEDRAIPYGVIAQKAMYEAQKQGY